MTLRVAIYARVSTQHQAQTQTIDQQLERVQQHVREQGWQLDPAHIFRDDGRSGANLNRPGLDRLRDLVRSGAVDGVVITEPDRLARNYVQQMIVVEEWTRVGCQVIFLDHPMNDDPHDRLLLQIRGAVAEYEHTLIADRMRRGRQQKYRAGLLLPWSRPPYGYRLHPDRPRDPASLTTDLAEAAIVQTIFAWYVGDNSSLQAVARRLQDQAVPTPSGKTIWSLATIRAILRQPAYTGQIYGERFRSRAARIRRSATHPIGTPHDSLVEQPPETWIPIVTIPAIITNELFAQAQAKLAQNQGFASRHNTTH